MSNYSVFRHYLKSGNYSTTDCEDLLGVHNVPVVSRIQPGPAITWGIGLLSVTIICSMSALGILLLRCIKKTKLYYQLLTYFVGLGVGSLLGSAIFHLLPDSFGVLSEDYTDKAWVAIVGVYLFFTVDRLMKIIVQIRKKRQDKHRHNKKHRHNGSAHHHKNNRPRAESRTELNPVSTVDFELDVGGRSKTEVTLMSNDPSIPRFATDERDGQNSGMVTASSSPPPGMHDNNLLETTIKLGESNDSLVQAKFEIASDEEDNDNKMKVNGHLIRNGNGRKGSVPMTMDRSDNDQEQSTHGLCSHDHDIEFQPGDSVIGAVAWMIIFGDGLHKFIDGLSIGAAYSYDLLTGISISVAVLCEEFPHELGDVAILINAGMSHKQALMYNMLSAVPCYAGFIIGVFVGELAEASSFVLALAGGMFLYIALATMVPEMNSTMETALEVSVMKSLEVSLMQYFGCFTGLMVMFLINHYGDQITFKETSLV